MSEELTPQEARIMEMLWKGMRREDIAKAIGRNRKTVYTKIKRIEAKLGTVDPQLIRRRLEDELFTRIPGMANGILINALKLYVPQQPGKIQVNEEEAKLPELDGLDEGAVSAIVTNLVEDEARRLRNPESDTLRGAEERAADAVDPPGSR